MRLVPWMEPLFRDREEAGRVLADAVAAVELDDPIVVGVARGGVAVAVEVARELAAQLTAVDVERVNAQGLRLGAVTADGPPYLHGVSEADVEPVVERARRAAAALEAGSSRDATSSRADRGRGRRRLITGFTLAAACRWARAEGVTRLVAATPVGRLDGLARVAQEADEVVSHTSSRRPRSSGRHTTSSTRSTSGTSAGLLSGQ